MRAHSSPSKIFQKIFNFFRKGPPLFFREKISAGEGVPLFSLMPVFQKNFPGKFLDFFLEGLFCYYFASSKFHQSRFRIGRWCSHRPFC